MCIIASLVRFARAIASYRLLTKVLSELLSVIYLLTLLLKHATKSYTRPLAII